MEKHFLFEERDKKRKEISEAGVELKKLIASCESNGGRTNKKMRKRIKHLKELSSYNLLKHF